MNNLSKSLNLAHSLAIIPIGAGILRTMQSQVFYIDWLGLFALLCLYVTVLVLAGRLKQGFWTGYMALATYVAWLTGGLLAALLLIIFGTLIALVIYSLRIEQSPVNASILGEVLGRIAIYGNGILVAHGVYEAIGGNIPFTDAQFTQVLPLVLAFASGYLVMQLLGVSITGASPTQRFKQAGRGLLLEPLLLMVTIVLPLIEAHIGTLPFVIIIGLTGAQALRHHQGRESHDALTRRLKELSLLNNLSQTIASNLELDEVLDSIYNELRNLVNATAFFVALYKDDQQTMEFPLVFYDGQLQHTPTRKQANYLSDYVIRTKKTVFLHAHDSEQINQLGVDPSTLQARVYIAVPLMIGGKVIGALVVAHDDNPHAFSDSDVTLIQMVASQASLALRNATLYDRTVTLANDLSLINQSLQDIMFNLDKDDAMRTASHIAIQVTNAQKAAVFLVQQDHNNTMHMVQSLGFSTKPQFDSLPYQPQLFRDGPRIITDIANIDDDVLKQHAIYADARAIIQLPLRSGNTMVGCLCVYHENPYFYEQPEINLLLMLANQITAALDNADLLQALELYAAEQGQLVQLSRIATLNLDLESIIYDICEMMVQIMEIPHAAIGLQNHESKDLTIYSPTSESLLSRVEIPLDVIPEFEEVINDATKLQVYYANSTDLHTQFAWGNYETLAILPMRINQKSIGLVILGDNEYREFTENDNRLLEMAAHQIAIHIQNARTHTLTQVTLLKRLEELSLLEESAQQISQALEIRRLIDNLLVAGLRATQAEFAALVLPTSDSPDLFEIILKEKTDDKTQQQRVIVEMQSGITKRVFETGKAIITENNAESDDYTVIPEMQGPYNSSITVPLLKGQTVIGVLDIESTQHNFFTQEHMSFIKSLAGHATVSLDNAQLLQEVNTSNERMRAILDSTRDGIILLDHDGRILDANTAAEELLHIPLRLYLEVKFPVAIRANLTSQELFEELVTQYEVSPQSLHEYEYSLPNNEDNPIVIKTSIAQVSAENNQQGHILFLRDISEEKELEALREENQSMVIHDLLGPVTSMITNMSWASQLIKFPGDRPLTETALPTLELSIKSGERLMGLVRTLRDIPLIAPEELKPKRMFVQELADAAYEVLSGFLRLGNIALEYDIPKGLMVDVDNELMPRVIWNLVHNAAKFSPENGKVLIIADTDHAPEGFVRIRVCDSGVGIPPQHRERIFGRFEQIEDQRPRDGGKGTGLGLNFCKLVVEAHGGKIWVADDEDNPLSGACFALTLPKRFTK